MKLFIASICMIMLLASTAGARPFFIPLDAISEQWSPTNFGYRVTSTQSDEQTVIVISLAADAAKAASRARLFLKKEGKQVLDCDVAFTTHADGSKEIILTINNTNLGESELLIYSRSYNAPLVSDFAGFRIALGNKWAEQAGAGYPPQGVGSPDP